MAIAALPKAALSFLSLRASGQFSLLVLPLSPCHLAHVSPGWASAQPIRRADESLEASELDVRVDAATPDGAAILGLQGDVGGGGRFRAGRQRM